LYSWGKVTIGNWLVHAYFERDSQFSDAQSSKYRLTVTDKAPPPTPTPPKSEPPTYTPPTYTPPPSTAPPASEPPEYTPPPTTSISAPVGTDVIIPSGTGVPGCEESYTCFQPNILSTKIDDTIVWFNADSAAHTITSGSPSNGGSIGVQFDSSLFLSGTTFSHKFTQSGTFPYFCIVHPWMSGEVIVAGSTKSSNDTFKSYADTGELVKHDPSKEYSLKTSGTKYSISYRTSSGQVTNAYIDTAATSIILNLINTNDGQITLKIPRELLDAKYGTRDDNFFVLADGKEIDFNESKNTRERTLIISYPAGTEEIEIIGSKVTGSGTETKSTFQENKIISSNPVNSPSTGTPYQIILNKSPSSVPFGSVYYFTGKVDIPGKNPAGYTVIIKDDDNLFDDELTRTFVKRDGTFTAPWIVKHVDIEEDKVEKLVDISITTAITIATFGANIPIEALSVMQAMETEFLDAPADVYVEVSGNEKQEFFTNCNQNWSINSGLDYIPVKYVCENTFQLRVDETLSNIQKAIRAGIYAFTKGDPEPFTNAPTGLIDFKKPDEAARKLAKADLRLEIYTSALPVWKNLISNAQKEIKDPKAITELTKAKKAFFEAESQLQIAKNQNGYGWYLLSDISDYKQNMKTAEKVNSAWKYGRDSIINLNKIPNEINSINKQVAEAYKIQYSK